MEKNFFVRVFIISIFFFSSVGLFCNEEFLAPPFLEVKETHTGVEFSINQTKLPAGTLVRYRSYNALYQTKGEGFFGRTKKVYVPYGTEFCAWVENKKGLRSKAVYHHVEKKLLGSLMEVLQPQPGVWNSDQMLIVNCDPGTEVVYSVDGSDPLSVGLLYTEPVLIKKKGEIMLRIKAVGKDGSIEEVMVLYKVSEDGENADKSEIKKVDKKGLSNDKKGFHFLSWSFLEFMPDDSIEYVVYERETRQLREGELRKYDGPIVLSRNKDAVLYWRSSAIANGEVQKITLPRKPFLQESTEKKRINSAITLSIENNDPQYLFYFEQGAAFSPNVPTSASPKFNPKGVTFDVKKGSHKRFTIRIRAFYDGIAHGELISQFEIDKRIPAKPQLVLDQKVFPTPYPVYVTANKKREGSIRYIVDPPLGIQKGDTFILTGDPEKSIEYTVAAYVEDDIGNKSDVVRAKCVIERNALYVDAIKGKKNAVGNSRHPFASFEEAFEKIKKSDKKFNDFMGNVLVEPVWWKVYLSSSIFLKTPQIITESIKIIGLNKPKISLSQNVGFVVDKGQLEIRDCSIERNEHRLDPREVPLFYVSQATLAFQSVSLFAREGGPGVKLYDSDFTCRDSELLSEQSNFSVILALKTSNVVIENTQLTAKGLSAITFSLNESTALLNNVQCSISPQCIGRAIEAWNSNVTLNNFYSIRVPENQYNIDSAVWYNAQTKVEVSDKPVIRGFKYFFTEGN